MLITEPSRVLMAANRVAVPLRLAALGIANNLTIIATMELEAAA
jgi:hypothetical protein